MYLSEGLKLVRITNANEDVVKLSRSYITGGDVKWYSHFRKKMAVSFKNETYKHFKSQQL